MNPADIISRAEHAIAAAHVALDVDVLERLYHPAFLLAQPDGTLESKDDVIRSFRCGERQWRLAQVDQLQVRIAGNTGVAVGRWIAIGVNTGKAFDYAARFLSVWTCEAGTWRNLAYSAAELT